MGAGALWPWWWPRRRPGTFRLPVQGPPEPPPKEREDSRREPGS